MRATEGPSGAAPDDTCHRKETVMRTDTGGWT